MGGCPTLLQENAKAVTDEIVKQGAIKLSSSTKSELLETPTPAPHTIAENVIKLTLNWVHWK